MTQTPSLVLGLLITLTPHRPSVLVTASSQAQGRKSADVVVDDQDGPSAPPVKARDFIQAALTHPSALEWRMESERGVICLPPCDRLIELGKQTTHPGQLYCNIQSSVADPIKTNCSRAHVHFRLQLGCTYHSLHHHTLSPSAAHMACFIVLILHTPPCTLSSLDPPDPLCSGREKFFMGRGREGGK